MFKRILIIKSWFSDPLFEFSHILSLQLSNKWFPPAEASGRRGYIKNILYRIINNSVQKDPPTTNYSDSPQSEMEGGTDKERQESCNIRDMGSYSGPHSEKNVPIKLQEATRIRRLQYSRGCNLVHRDSLGQGDTGWSVMKGAYEHCRRLKSLERFCSILSPVEVIYIFVLLQCMYSTFSWIYCSCSTIFRILGFVCF